jgi:pyruvate/2-oxoglutarate dehydrogenase complex dihydrolipoamide acyltransferase (E2) component
MGRKRAVAFAGTGAAAVIAHNQPGYTEVPYPKLRRELSIMVRSVRRKHMIHGLIEVDVTRARQQLREQKAKTGESLSFTAFIAACVAQAVAENKNLHACRKGSKHLVLFDEVDVATQIEREMGGQKQPVTYIIRGANKKTLREIHQEIRAAQAAEPEHAWTAAKATGWILLLPIFPFRLLWRAFWWVRGRHPLLQKTLGGTVGVSAVGMFGTGGGWGIPLAYRTLDVTVGGIAEKPGVVDGHIAIREYLCLTLSIDHDIVDGAPAARFTQRLKDLIESGFGLFDVL